MNVLLCDSSAIVGLLIFAILFGATIKFLKSVAGGNKEEEIYDRPTINIKKENNSNKNKPDIRFHINTTENGLEYEIETDDDYLKGMAEFMIENFTNSRGYYKKGKIKSPKGALIKYVGEVEFYLEEDLKDIDPKARFAYFFSNLDEAYVEYDFYTQSFEEFFNKIPKDKLGEHEIFYKNDILLNYIINELDDLLSASSQILFFNIPERKKLIQQGYFKEIKVSPNQPGFDEVVNANLESLKMEELRKLVKQNHPDAKIKRRTDAEEILKKDEDFINNLIMPLSVTNKFYDLLKRIKEILKEDLENSSKYYPESFKENLFDEAKEYVDLYLIERILKSKDKIKYREKLFIEKHKD